MGFDGGDETDGGLSSSSADSEIDVDTQLFESQSPSEREDPNADELESTLQFIETVPLDVEEETQVLQEETQVLEEETQVLEEGTQLFEDMVWDENVRTQLVPDECEEHVSSGSDGEGTDRTEVLGDGNEVSDEDSEGEVGNDYVGLENVQPSPLFRGKEAMAVDFDASIDERRNSGHNVSTTSPAPMDNTAGKMNSGSARRSFTSVRAASLRASGIAAARRMSSMERQVEPGSIQRNCQSREEHAHNTCRTASIEDSVSVGTVRMDVDRDCETRNHNQNMLGFDIETKSKSAVRRLFTDDIPPDSNGPEVDNAGVDEGRDCPEFLVSREFSGLNYLGSQEPGEQSQANALEIVDKFITVNDVDLSQEINHGNAVKENSPSVPSAKGPRTLAHKINTGSPVGQVGIFDWVDSREDEGGGDFFSKKKEVLLNQRERRSYTHPPKPKHLNVRKGKNITGRHGEKEEGSSVHEKIIGVPNSDSRLLLRNLKEKVVQISGAKTKKNLFYELDKQLAPGFSEQQLEASNLRKDAPNMYDVGNDTQMAAEAMEALVCRVPDNHDEFLVISKITGSNGSVQEKKSHTGRVSIQTRAVSKLGLTSRKSERKVNAKPSGEVPILSRKRSKNSKEEQPIVDSGTKARKKYKSMADVQLCNGNEANRYTRSGKISSESVRLRTVGAVDQPHPKEATTEIQEYRIPSTVARHTRQSCAVTALKKPETQTNRLGEGTSTPTEISNLGGKKRRSCRIADAPKPSTANGKRSKLGHNEVADVAKNKRESRETVKLDGPHLKKSTTSHEKINALREFGGRRNMSARITEPGNLDGSSTVADAVAANAQSTEGTCINLRKRKTRSSITHSPTSSGKKSQGSLIQQDVEPGSAYDAVNCSSAANGKTARTRLVQGKDSIEGNTDALSSPQDLMETSKLEVSPSMKIRPCGSPCVTPVNCTMATSVKTPCNEASPICIGNGYHTQSCKRRLLKSSLVRELDNLATDEFPTPPFKSLRKRRDMANVRVLFSRHLDKDIIKQQKKIMTRMGVSIASSSSEATHFVADEFVRTRNMLEAIALGKPVVTHFWLENCGQAKCFIDEKNYLLRDSRKEKEIGFRMPVSLARACQSPLLEGKRVFITPSVKPCKEVVASLVKAVHGQAVERIGRSATKDDKVPEDLLVLSCEEDYDICVPLLEKGATIYSSELLLNGIVIQKLEYERHCIFNDHVKKTRSTTWLRKDGKKFVPVTKRK